MVTTSGKWNEGAPRFRGRAPEVHILDRFVDAVRSGQSRVLVVRGEAGVGKTALLDHVAEHARGCEVIRAVGVQSEMELAFAGLHQMCGHLLEPATRLPAPQRRALETAFGLRNGPAPDRFLVGLAVLSLLSEEGARRPLICLIDDRQWLDSASAQALAFAGRRLMIDSVGMIFATRDPADDLAGFAQLPVAGLPLADALALLDSALPGPLDARVRTRLVAETRGNPLALLELPRGLSPAELAGGFGLPAAQPLAGQLELSFGRKIAMLPDLSRRLVQLAGADSTGDSPLLWRAADLLGIPAQAAEAAVEAGLLELGAHVHFRHPLVRSAAYRSAPPGVRQELHRALATVTDGVVDPDRRAWHLAHASPGPDDEVALELERGAERAQRRGGMAAAAAFLEKAAVLTAEPKLRTRRLLAAARTKSDAGALDEALGLLFTVEAGPMDLREIGEAEFLRGEIALDRRLGGEAVRLLLSAAERLRFVSAEQARAAYLDALVAAVWSTSVQSSRVREVAVAAQNAPPGPTPPRVLDALLDALTLRVTDGYAASATALRDALDRVLELAPGVSEVDRWMWLAGGRIGQIIAMELWDETSWRLLAVRQAEFARASGVLMHLGFALNYLARRHILAGDLEQAQRLIEEDELIAEAIGSLPISDTAMMLAAWRGQEAETAKLVAATSEAAALSSASRLEALASYATAVLHNGFGRGEEACEAARLAFEHEPMGYGSHIVPELIEAAARVGDSQMLATAHAWLLERCHATPTPWLQGIEARAAALTSAGDTAERWHRESIELLGRTGIRIQLARSHLLYGEWLRRENRRIDARDQLRIAHKMLLAMGASAFAERARHELAATGESPQRQPETSRPTLTVQERQVAELALGGLSNSEIGARMFISPRTVQYHLRKVFSKLGISSRKQLHLVLREGDPGRGAP